MNILLLGARGMVGDGVLRWLIASARADHLCRRSAGRMRLSVGAMGGAHRLAVATRAACDFEVLCLAHDV